MWAVQHIFFLGKDQSNRLALGTMNAKSKVVPGSCESSFQHLTLASSQACVAGNLAHFRSTKSTLEISFSPCGVILLIRYKDVAGRIEN